MLFLRLLKLAISSAYTCTEGDSDNNLILLDDKCPYHDLACGRKI